MFVTVITLRKGNARAQLQQIDAPTVKDCLVAWAGKVQVEGLDDAGRTRLRGDMADFVAPASGGLVNVWKLETDLGLGGDPRATLVVVETFRH